MKIKRYVISSLLIVIIGAICFGVYLHSVNIFAGRYLDAVSQKDVTQLRRLILPESITYIDSNYPEYLSLMTQSESGYMMVPPGSEVTAISEEPLNDTLRKTWFGYLANPGSVRGFSITIDGSNPVRLSLYVARTTFGWKHVIQDPAELYQSSKK